MGRQAQININPNPIAGETVEHCEFNVNLLDTGQVGIGVTWDFSNQVFNPQNIRTTSGQHHIET